MKFRWVYILTTPLLLMGCNASKFVPDSYLLDKVRVETADKSLDASTLQTYVRQQGNSRWFSLFRIPLGTYSLAGRDSTKWLNRMLKHVGEAPVVFDTLQARRSMDDLTTAMRNMGYMHARTELLTEYGGGRRSKSSTGFIPASLIASHHCAMIFRTVPSPT